MVRNVLLGVLTPDLDDIDVFGKIRNLVAIEDRENKHPELKHSLNHVVHIIVVEELAHRVPYAPRRQEDK